MATIFARGFWSVLALVLLGTGLACADGTVRIGLQQVPTDEVYKARDWGSRFGLKVKVSTFSSAGDSLKAFLAGRVDIANGGAARLVTLALQQPREFVIIAANQFGGDRYGLMVAAASPYKTIADLKRKKIGAVTGSGSYGTFLLYLDKQGLSEKDFAIVNMKVEDLRASVEHGIIDAGIAWEPHVAIAETLGGVRRIASMDGVNESPNFVLARRTFLESQPDLVVRYIATLIELEKFIQADPGEAGRLAAAEIGKGGVAVKPEAMALALRRIKLSPRLTPALLGELEEIAKSMLSTGKIKQMPDFAALARYDLYDRAASIAVK